MTTAREEILTRIRTALTDGTIPPAVPRDYTRSSTVEDVVALLVDRLEDYGATVVLTTTDALAATVTAQIQGRTRVAPGLDLTIPGTQPDNDHDPTDLDHTDTAVTGCAAACAQTGTIALNASPDQGRRALSLIPDRHVCIVHTRQIVGTVPELVTRLNPTAPTTLISGPSATSDIELNRVQGVHGPRELVVVLVSR